MNNLRNRIRITLIFFLLVASLLPIPLVSAWVWNPGVTFNCDNEYWSTTTPLDVDNVTVDVHWISTNGIGWNVSYAGSYIYNNLSSIKSYPRSSVGYIVNWTQQKPYTVGVYSYYYIGGLKPNHEYQLYSNGSSTPHTANATGVLYFASSVSSTNRNYALWDAGVPGEWYVATNGSDITGSGSITSPFQTIEKAISESSTSDTIYLRGAGYGTGIFTPTTSIALSRSGTALDWYTISNYNGELVIFNGTNCPGSGTDNQHGILELTNCDYVRIHGIRFNYSACMGVTIESGCSYIRMDNCSIGNCTSSAFKVKTGQSYIWFDYNYVYNNMNNWKGYTLSQEVISLSDTSYFYIHHDTLIENHCENIDCKNGANHGEIHHNFINTSGGHTYKGGKHFYGGFGIYIDGYQEIDHNISIYNNNLTGNNTLISINAEHPESPYYGSTRDINIYNNILHKNGKYTGASENGACISIGDNGNTAHLWRINVYGNTIIRPATYDATTCIYMRETSGYYHYCKIENNIILNLNSSSNYCLYISAISSVESLTNKILLDYNDYYTWGGAVPHISWSDGAKDINASTGGSNRVTSNPLLQSRHTCNYHLNTTSPCIGAALASLMPSFDYDDVSRPQEGTYDIGAFEYVGSVPSVPASFTFGSVSPANASTGISFTPTCQVYIRESHGYRFNFTFQENSTGVWVTTFSGVDRLNSTLGFGYLNAIAFSTKYWWRLAVVNGTTWHNETYHFTTLAPATPSFIFSGIVPVNGSTGRPLAPDIYFTINETHGYGYNVTVYTNHTGAWVLLWGYYAGDLSNGSYTLTYSGAGAYSTKYWWKVIAWNGTTSHSETYHFTTVSAPAAPTNIRVYAVRANWTTSSSIYLSWTKTANCTHTYIYRSNIGYMIGASNIASTTNTYYNNTLLDPSIRYYYTLKPYNSSSLTWGPWVNVSLAETENLTSYGSSWVDFKGWMATDKSIQARFYFSEDAGFTGISLNETEKRVSHDIVIGAYSDANSQVYNLHRRSQSFLVGADDFYLKNVTVKLRRPAGYLPGFIYCYLYEADVNHYPTGAILSSGSRNGDSILTTGEWFNISMGSYELTAATQYCIVLACDCGSFNAVNWYYDSAHLYTNGKAALSSDDGATWGLWSNTDFLFRIFGNIPTGSFAAFNSDNLTVSSSGLFTIEQASLEPGQLYYYQVRANDTRGNMTRGNTRYTLTRPEVPTFLTMSPFFINSSLYITWLRGAGANTTVLTYTNTVYPSSPAEGTLVYNGTGTSCWIHNITFNLTYRFSLFSYASWIGLHRYSSAATIPWGGISFNCYNESSGLPIGFNVLISDKQGNHVYYGPNLYGFQFINITEIPLGSQIGFYVSNSSGKYNPHMYNFDLTTSIFYNLSFYLAPTLTPPAENDSFYYGIKVVDMNSAEISDVLVTIKAYMVASDSFEIVTSGYTAADGVFAAYLRGSSYYKVFLNKTGYKDSVNDFPTPSSGITITYVLEFIDIVIQPDRNPMFYVFFEDLSSRSNSTLFLHYHDTLDMTTDVHVYVYEHNLSTGLITLFYSNEAITDSEFYLNITGLRWNNSYTVNLYYNHTEFGAQSLTAFFDSWHTTLITPYHLNLVLTGIFRNGAMVLSHFMMFLLLLALFYWVDKEHVGIGLIIIGGLFICINVYLGLDDALTAAAGGVIPALMMVVGAMKEVITRGILG